MSDEEREKHKKHIENVIEETFKIIKLVYANQQEKEGLKGSKNGSRIIFPQKRKKMGFHQMVCYGPQEASLLSVVLFVPRPLGIREPHQCLRGKGHELGCTSSYNSSALAE